MLAERRVCGEDVCALRDVRTYHNYHSAGRERRVCGEVTVHVVASRAIACGHGSSSCGEVTDHIVAERSRFT